MQRPSACSLVAWRCKPSDVHYNQVENTPSLQPPTGGEAWPPLAAELPPGDKEGGALVAGLGLAEGSPFSLATGVVAGDGRLEGPALVFPDGLGPGHAVGQLRERAPPIAKDQEWRQVGQILALF